MSTPKPPAAFYPQTQVVLAWAVRQAASPPSEAPQGGPRALLRPLPQLPARDRAPLAMESRMRVAVALDVVCSATRKVAPGPTVLAGATRAWLSLRDRAHSGEVLEALIEQAHGTQATARARISRALTQAASGERADTAEDAALGPMTTAHSVAAANRRIEATGQAIVAEMVLWLASRERVEFWRG